MKRTRALVWLCGAVSLLSLLLVAGAPLRADDAICPQPDSYWTTSTTIWPVTTLTLGVQTYTQVELIAFFSGAADDASVVLAQQLIAARLNVAAGVISDVIGPTLLAADNALAQFSGRLPYAVSLDSDIGAQLLTTAVTLTAFNVGQLNSNCVEMTATAQATLTPTATPDMTATPDPNATATPSADLTIRIIVEGPVEQINVNIITVYDIDIILPADDPIVTVVQIGDFVRVDGVLDDDGNLDDGHFLRVISTTIFVVQIDVIFTDGAVPVWHDSGDCGNPPPPWAPAHGWRRHCEGGDDDDDGDRGRGHDD